jgi:hypothetical protein
MTWFNFPLSISYYFRKDPKGCCLICEVILLFPLFFHSNSRLEFKIVPPAFSSTCLQILIHQPSKYTKPVYFQSLAIVIKQTRIWILFSSFVAVLGAVPIFHIYLHFQIYLNYLLFDIYCISNWSFSLQFRYSVV